MLREFKGAVQVQLLIGGLRKAPVVLSLGMHELALGFLCCCFWFVPFGGLTGFLST